MNHINAPAICCGVLITLAATVVSSHAVATTLITEDFEALAVGALPGQNGWQGLNDWNVTDQGNIVGTQSLRVTGGTNNSAVYKSFSFTPDATNSTDLMMTYTIGSSATDSGFVVGGLSTVTTILDIFETRRAANTQLGAKVLGTGVNFQNTNGRNFDVDGDGDLDQFAGTYNQADAANGTLRLFTFQMTARYVPGVNNDFIRILAQVDGGAFTDVLQSFGGDNDGVGTDRNFGPATRDADGFYPVGTDFASGTINALFGRPSPTSNLQIDSVLVTSEVIPEPSAALLGTLSLGALLLRRRRL